MRCLAGLLLVAACTTAVPPSAPAPLPSASPAVPPAAQSAFVAPPPPSAAASAPPDGDAGLLDPRCEHATDVDVDVAYKAQLCFVQSNDPPYEGPTLPKALRLTIDVPPRVKVGDDATVRVSLVNTGDTPLPVVVDDRTFEVAFTDVRGKDPHETLGSCLIDGQPSLQIDMYCGGAYLRFVLQPGGNVHRDFTWVGRRYKWGARRDKLPSCDVEPAGAVPAGRYGVKASVNLFAYGPMPGTGPHGPPILPSPAHATLVVAP